MTKIELLEMKGELQKCLTLLEQAKSGKLPPEMLQAMAAPLPWGIIIPALVEIITALIPLFEKLIDNMPSDEE